jgi:hypothetical protein
MVTVVSRPSSPHRRGNQRRHDANDSVSTGETLDARNGNYRKSGEADDEVGFRRLNELKIERDVLKSGVGNGRTALFNKQPFK